MASIVCRPSAVRCRPNIVPALLPAIALQAGINGFAFQREDAEHALVNASERFAGDEAFQGFNS
jgi:hypothetical protein